MGEARAEFIGALALLAQEIERSAKAATAGKFVNAAAELQQAVAHQAGERFLQVGDVLVKFAASLHHDLGGSGRSGGANVGDEIGDGEIGFVADAGNYRNFGGEDGARHLFFVEGPQIFERAAAAREDQHIDHSLAIEELHGAHDFLGGTVTLDAHGIDREMHIAEAASQNADHIAHSRAARGSNQSDAAGQERQGLFAIRGEEAFRFEAFLELLEGQLQSAQADGLNVLDIDLVFAARFVDADGAAHRDAQAVFGAKLHGAELILEADALRLRAFVLQGAVNVAGLRFVAVGDFAGDPDVGKVAREEVADPGGQLGDREGAAFRHKVELKLGHRLLLPLRFPDLLQ